MGILMKNGVSYSAPYAGYTKTLKEKLVAGETSVTFVDNCITNNVMVDWEVSKFGLVPTDKIEGNHSLTFVFPAQQEDVWVKATFTSISSNSEEPSNKMVFLKATGQQYIELPDVRGNEGIKLEFYGFLGDYTGGSQGIFGTTWAWDCLCVTNSAPSAGSIGIEWERSGDGDALTVPWNKPVYFVFDTNGEIRADEQKITFTPTQYSNNTLKLFCGGDNGSYAGFLWASEMKIYKNDVLVKDLIPTKVKGVPCYYDVIGRKPYFSKTSTPFQLEEIEYKPTPCISVYGSQQILHIPMTFSTGNENYILKSKMYFSSAHAAAVNDYAYFVCAWNGSTNMVANDYGGAISIYPTGGRNLVSMNGIKDRWVDIEINQAQNYVKIDGVIYNNTWRSGTSQFYIQGGNTGTASTAVFYGETQIYQNGTLIANYIPSVKANGIGYFYDTVSQTDKVSEGSSSFGYACF